MNYLKIKNIGENDWYLIKYDNNTPVWAFPLAITISDCCEYCDNKIISISTMDMTYYDITADDDFKDGEIGEETQQNMIENLLEDYHHETSN